MKSAKTEANKQVCLGHNSMNRTLHSAALNKPLDAPVRSLLGLLPQRISEPPAYLSRDPNRHRASPALEEREVLGAFGRAVEELGSVQTTRDDVKHATGVVDTGAA